LVFSSDLPNIVEEREPLARFIFSREHFAETKGVVKPKAFLPDPGGETSVFRTLSLSSGQVWDIGNGIRNEKAKAYAKIGTGAVRRVGLLVNSAIEDHPRHAVIVGWPPEKDRKLILALQLSSEASLHIQG
jgi:hypothetical protein